VSRHMYLSSLWLIARISADIIEVLWEIEGLTELAFLVTLEVDLDELTCHFSELMEFCGLTVSFLTIFSFHDLLQYFPDKRHVGVRGFQDAVDDELQLIFQKEVLWLLVRVMS